MFGLLKFLDLEYGLEQISKFWADLLCFRHNQNVIHVDEKQNLSWIKKHGSFGRMFSNTIDFTDCLSPYIHFASRHTRTLRTDRLSKPSGLVVYMVSFKFPYQQAGYISNWTNVYRSFRAKVSQSLRITLSPIGRRCLFSRFFVSEHVVLYKYKN
jgi:hypothetical protein